MSNRKSFVFIYVVFMGNRFGQGSFDYPILKNVLECNSDNCNCILAILVTLFSPRTFQLLPQLESCETVILDTSDTEEKRLDRRILSGNI